MIRLFFMHIQKTDGTSLTNLLETIFDKKIYPFNFDNEVINHAYKIHNHILKLYNTIKKKD